MDIEKSYCVSLDCELNCVSMESRNYSFTSEESAESFIKNDIGIVRERFESLGLDYSINSSNNSTMIWGTSWENRGEAAIWTRLWK